MEYAAISWIKVVFVSCAIWGNYPEWLDNVQPTSQPVSYWIGILRHGDDDQRRKAIQALEEFDTPAKDVFPCLLETLKKDPSAKVRTSAALALASLAAEGPSSKQGKVQRAIVPALVAALQDKDERVRLRAAQSLGELGYYRKDAVTTLIKALENPEINDRVQAAQTLRRFGTQAKPAVSHLQSLLDDPEEDVRLEAAFSLWMLEKQAQPAALQVLIKALESSDSYVQFTATRLACEMGPLASTALPQLKKLMKHKEPMLRSCAAQAVWLIERKASEVLPVLIHNLGKDAGWAFGTLRQMGPEADEAVPALIEFLKSPPGPAESILNDVLRDDYLMAALGALAAIDSKAPVAIPVITPYLNHPSKEVRLSAAGALWKIEHRKEAVLPIVHDCLAEKDVIVASIAIHFAAHMGPTAREVRPALRKLLKNEDPYLREEAAKALKKICRKKAKHQMRAGH